MYIKLPRDYVDPRSQAPLPSAVMSITGADFSLGTGQVAIQVSVYATPAAAAAGGGPMSTQTLVLTPDEVAQQQPAILAACYQVLMARPQFANASLVA